MAVAKPGDTAPSTFRFGFARYLRYLQQRERERVSRPRPSFNIRGYAVREKEEQFLNNSVGRKVGERADSAILEVCEP